MNKGPLIINLTMHINAYIILSMWHIIYNKFAN